MILKWGIYLTFISSETPRRRRILDCLVQVQIFGKLRIADVIPLRHVIAVH
jgi:hypothetical protein